MGWISDLVAGRRQRPEVLPSPPAAPGPRDVQIATAALLLEVSAADHEVEDRERRAILTSLESAFGLTAAETAEVVRAASRRSDRAVSIYEFTRLVDRSFTPEQKATVIELAFRVAFADERLAGEEEHLIRRLANLLHVEHAAFIAAKLRARG